MGKTSAKTECPRCPECKYSSDYLEYNEKKSSFVSTDKILSISSYKNVDTGLNAGGGARQDSMVSFHKLCNLEPKNHSTCMWKYDGKMLNTLNDQKLYVDTKNNIAIFNANCKNTENISNCTWNITKVNNKDAYRIVNNNGFGFGIPTNNNLNDDYPIEVTKECNNESVDERCYWKINILET